MLFCGSCPRLLISHQVASKHLTWLTVSHWSVMTFNSSRENPRLLFSPFLVSSSPLTFCKLPFIVRNQNRQSTSSLGVLPPWTMPQRADRFKFPSSEEPVGRAVPLDGWLEAIVILTPLCTTDAKKSMSCCCWSNGSWEEK